MDVGVRTFEIAHCLGRGGFGEVYRARMRTSGGLESDVAIKVLRKDLDPASQSVQRLRDEGKLLARLDHPVILRAHDLVVLEGRVALVTEYIAGEDLEAVLRGPGRLPMRGLLQVVARVARALDAAWSTPLDDGTPMQLVHRDIKPSNIRLGRHGEVKLLDFGIARTDALVREARTQTDMLIGTLRYMAPERFRGFSTNPASDVFALGATLYESLSGERFYGEMDFPAVAGVCMSALDFEEYLGVRLARVPDDTDPELFALLRETLVSDPQCRIGSAELADRAERLAERCEGEPLERWARGRAWRPAPREIADMTGKTLSEDTVHRGGLPAAPLAHPALSTGPSDETAPALHNPTPNAKAPSSTLVRAAQVLGLVALLGVVGGSLGIGLAGASGLTWVAVNQRETAAREELANAAPGSASVEVPPVGPPPEERAEPTRALDPDPPVPEPAPAARPSVTSAAPAPQPAPAPSKPEVPATASVTVTGADLGARAKGPGGEHVLPADLPAGTWELWITPPGGTPFSFKQIEVAGGEQWVVHCKSRGLRCDAYQI